MSAKVAKPENALPVRDNNELGRIRPVSKQLRDVPAIVGANEHAARSLEDKAEPLTSEAHCRGIDQRLDFIDVIAHHSEEQRLVAIVQRVEGNVFFQIRGQITQVGQYTLDLLLHRKHVRGQETS